jgi:hypothetical protein
VSFMLCLYGFWRWLSELFALCKEFFSFRRKMSCREDISEEATKDPGIKLFGRKIPLPECRIPARSDVMVRAVNLFQYDLLFFFQFLFFFFSEITLLLFFLFPCKFLLLGLMNIQISGLFRWFWSVFCFYFYYFCSFELERIRVTFAA